VVQVVVGQESLSSVARRELVGPDTFLVGGATPEGDLAILSFCNASIIGKPSSNVI
jgi:hypothetical protein